MTARTLPTASLLLLLIAWTHHATAGPQATSTPQRMQALLAACHDALSSAGPATLRTAAIAFHEATGEHRPCRPAGLFPVDAAPRIEAGKSLLDAADAVLLTPVLNTCGRGRLCDLAASLRDAGTALDGELDPRALAMAVIPPTSRDALGAAIDTPAALPRHAAPRVNADDLRDELMVAAIADGCSSVVAGKFDALLRDSSAPLDPRELRENLDDSAASPACLNAFGTGARLLLHVATLDAVHAAILAPQSFAKLAADARINHARWEAYNFGGGINRVQLPWEIAVNGALYKGLPRDGSADLWPEPPTSAWILLHPSVGIAPFSIDGAPSGVVGAIEAVGWSRWRYSSEHTRSREWGGSLAAVYVPDGRGDGWYPGLVVRTPYKGISIVYARTRDEASDDAHLLAFSVDIGGLVFRDKGVTTQLVCAFGLSACPR